MGVLKRVLSVFDRMPFVGYTGECHKFLIVDTSGRIILEDCDSIKSFTESLLVIGQGNLLITVIGTGLRLHNISQHSAELVGSVRTINMEKSGVK